MNAAFDLIAERGFEGLRTRDVAARVGINIGTLHYYFPTKEDLVAGVAEYLAGEYATQRAPVVRMPAGTPSALVRLRQEFADAVHYRFERPAMQVVSLELQLRAARDPVLRPLIEPLLRTWRATLEDIIAEGIREAVFRANLDPAAGATLLMATLWGAASLLHADQKTFERACAELERAFVVDEPSRVHANDVRPEISQSDQGEFL